MIDQKINIVVIEGTSRPNRRSMQVAQLIANHAANLPDVEVKIADPQQFSLPNDGNDTETQDPKYNELVAWADGFFIVTPEYNNSFPGSLKRMLDSSPLANYRLKPAILVGVSDGQWGGVRAVVGLAAPLRRMGFMMSNKDIYFPYVQDKFDGQGKLIDNNYIEKIQASWEELLLLAKALKPIRQ